MTTTFYSARYLDFLNGTFRGEPHPITNDFWDYSASFPDVPLDRQYNRSLTHGVEGLGDITVFLQNTTNQNELLTAIAATAVALKQAGVLVGDLADLPNHTGRHYIIDGDVIIARWESCIPLPCRGESPSPWGRGCGAA